MSFIRLTLLVMGLAFATVFQLVAQNEDLQLPDKKLTIGIKSAPPFVMQDGEGKWEGISIDLWHHIAKKIDLDYTLVETDLEGLLEGVETGVYDASIAAITITSEREQSIDFTHPYYNSGLGIALSIEGDEGELFAIIRGIFSTGFMKAVSLLLLVLLVVGILLWSVERRKNEEQFGGTVWEGIGSGLWWSAVTMTTVGYGDKAPTTFLGRAIGLIWMFAAIIIISGFTASIAASLTVSGLGSAISGPSDLYKGNVVSGTVQGSTSEQYLIERNIRYRTFENPEASMKALVEGEVNAFVYDAPMLRYLSNTDYKSQVLVLPTVFERQYYGLALPDNSPYQEVLDRLILEFTSSPSWQKTLRKYLGE